MYCELRRNSLTQIQVNCARIVHDKHQQIFLYLVCTFEADKIEEIVHSELQLIIVDTLNANKTKVTCNPFLTIKCTKTFLRFCTWKLSKPYRIGEWKNNFMSGIVSTWKSSIWMALLLELEALIWLIKLYGPLAKSSRKVISSFPSGGVSTIINEIH